MKLRLNSLVNVAAVAGGYVGSRKLTAKFDSRIILAVGLLCIIGGLRIPYISSVGTGLVIGSPIVLQYLSAI